MVHRAIMVRWKGLEPPTFWFVVSILWFCKFCKAKKSSIHGGFYAFSFRKTWCLHIVFHSNKHQININSGIKPSKPIAFIQWKFFHDESNLKKQQNYIKKAKWTRLNNYKNSEPVSFNRLTYYFSFYCIYHYNNTRISIEFLFFLQ